MSFGKEQSIDRDLIKKHILRLDLDNPKKDYDELIKSIGNAQAVLIGEATHGTEEFYHERCLITQRLIEEKDFTIVACEADWPDTFKVNRYVQNLKLNDSKNAREALNEYQRFPTWMWRNYQISYFVEWLRKHNDELEAKEKKNGWNRYDKTGFYGLDLYSLFRSMDTVVHYLESVDSKAAKKAKKAYACFDHFDQSTESYSFATYFRVAPPCEKEVVKVLTDMIKRRTSSKKKSSEEIDELFAAEMDAIVVKNSEEYYRKFLSKGKMINGAQSWNLRDAHMMNMLKSLMGFLKRQRGKPVKAVVWAHNSHVGDARYTHKGEVREERLREWNIGQLAREQLGMDNVYNIGFTTHTGTVTAAPDWDMPRETKNVNPSRPESFEHLFHTVSEETTISNFLLIFNYIQEKKKLPISQDLINELANKARLRERAIGVIYRPDTELRSHYSRARISLQFDAVIHIDITNALKPLPGKTEDEIDRHTLDEKELPETFPVGE